jgi:hypothetical protein
MIFRTTHYFACVFFIANSSMRLRDYTKHLHPTVPSLYHDLPTPQGISPVTPVGGMTLGSSMSVLGTRYHYYSEFYLYFLNFRFLIYINFADWESHCRIQHQMSIYTKRLILLMKTVPVTYRRILIIKSKTTFRLICPRVDRTSQRGRNTRKKLGLDERLLCYLMYRNQMDLIDFYVMN